MIGWGENLIGPKMANKHGDHEATCLCCKEFYIGYDHDLSDITPGNGLEIHCGAIPGKWLDNSSTREEYHELIHRGGTCKFFNPTEVKSG